MKKVFYLLIVVFLGITFAACDEIEDDEDGVITWTGLEDTVVVRGDAIDFLEGVTATDTIDGDITDQIEIVSDDDFSTHLAGGYTVTYQVENSTGVVSTETKYYAVQVGHNVANGDFSLGAFGWTLDEPGGKADVDFIDGQASFTIENAGTSWWGIQLYQMNVVFEANRTYKTTVVASSPDERSISLGFEDPDDGFRMLNPGFMPMALNAEETTYDMYFTADESYGNVKVVLYLGSQLESDTVTGEPHTVHVHEVNIERVIRSTENQFEGIEPVDVLSGALDFDPLEGVTYSDESFTGTIDVLGDLPTEVQVASTYYLTYLVELDDGSVVYDTRQVFYSLPKDFEYQAINGGFENGFVGWTQDVIQTVGTGEATFTNNGDGTVSVLVEDASDAAWHIQLQQANSTFRAGESYVVRLIIKADQDRTVDVEVVHPGSGFAQIAPTLVQAEVTDEWREYEIHFTAEENYENGKIGLLLGNTDGLQPDGVTFTIDEFQVYKYDPFNESFIDIHEPWVLDNITGSINENDEIEVVFEEGQVGPDPWNNQLYQSSGSELVAGHTYEVEVRIKSSIARTIRAWIEDVNKGYAAIANGAETELVLEEDTYQILTYTIEITEDNATTNAKFVVMFGDGAIQGQAHTVTIDYFRVTDITNE